MLESHDKFFNLCDKDKYPRPSLKLFLSVDIVGSTAFKQSAFQVVNETSEHSQKTEDEAKAVSHVEGRSKWLEFFLMFFSQVSLFLDNTWEESIEEISTHAGKDIGTVRELLGGPPAFWKGIGDEAVLVKNIENPVQAYASVVIFSLAMQQLREKVRQSGVNIDVKCAGWLAGFPVNNKQIALGGFNGKREHEIEPNGDEEISEGDISVFENLLRLKEIETGSHHSGVIIDYVGPQIDLGFRLAAKSTPRRMMLSADLAYLLLAFSAHDAINHEWKESNWKADYNMAGRICFSETEVLRGVLSGNPYPLIWFDMKADPGLHDAEDKALGISLLGRDPNTIRLYLVEFFRHCKVERGIQWMNLPFICDPTHGCFGTVSSEQRTQIEGIQLLWEIFSDKAQGEVVDNDSDSELFSDTSGSELMVDPKQKKPPISD